MTKITLGERTKTALLEGIEQAKEEKTNMEQVIITTPNHLRNKSLGEDRSQRLQAMLTKREMNELVKVIGRETKSDIARELITYMLGIPTSSPKNRDLIISLIKNNN